MTANAEHTPERLSAVRECAGRLAAALGRWAATYARGEWVLRKDAAAVGDAIGAIDDLSRELYRLRCELVGESLADHDARMAYTATLVGGGR